MTTVPLPTSAPMTSDRPPLSGGYPRIAAVISLVTVPLLAGVSELLQPDFGNDGTHRLAAMAGVLPRISAVTFLVGQLPMMLAVLVIGQLVRRRHPWLGSWGASLGFLGAFGHTVFGGMSLVWLVMAGDANDRHRATYAGLLDRLNNSPVMVFSILGLVGTVLGLLLLSIGLFRGHIGPRWVGPAFWAFLGVEFVGTSLTPTAAYLSVLCFSAPLFALALYVSRQRREARRHTAGSDPAE